jgi:hypothetical protein
LLPSDSPKHAIYLWNTISSILCPWLLIQTSRRFLKLSITLAVISDGIAVISSQIAVFSSSSVCVWSICINFRLRIAPKEEIARHKIGRTCEPGTVTAMRDDVPRKEPFQEIHC